MNNLRGKGKKITFTKDLMCQKYSWYQTQHDIDFKGLVSSSPFCQTRFTEASGKRYHVDKVKVMLHAYICIKVLGLASLCKCSPNDKQILRSFYNTKIKNLIRSFV